jgi:hypothetical protein
MSTTTERRKTLEERGLTRLTFDVPVPEGDKLDMLAGRLGYNKVTTVLRSLRILTALTEAEAKGATVTINYPDGSKERLLAT